MTVWKSIEKCKIIAMIGEENNTPKQAKRKPIEPYGSRVQIYENKPTRQDLCLCVR